MRYFKKLFLSLVAALTITILTPAAVPFMPEYHGLVVRADDNNSRTVYITPTGKKYHVKKCGNGTYRKATLSNAKSRNLTACKKCF